MLPAVNNLEDAKKYDNCIIEGDRVVFKLSFEPLSNSSASVVYIDPLTICQISPNMDNPDHFCSVSLYSGGYNSPIKVNYIDLIESWMQY